MSPIKPGDRGRGAASSGRRHGRVATPPTRPIQWSPATHQWLDFLAGLLAQAASAEHGAANAAETLKAS